MSLSAAEISVFESLADLSDEVLLEQYITIGNRDAFTEIVHRYQDPLAQYLRKYLGKDNSYALDILQEVFFKVHEKCSQFDTRKKFRPYIYTIARHTAIDFCRKQKQYKNTFVELPRTVQDFLEKSLLATSKEPVCLLEELEAATAVENEVGALSKKMQQTVLLVYYEGMKYDEAAEVLGIPIGTIKSRLHTALKELRIQLSIVYPELTDNLQSKSLQDDQPHVEQPEHPNRADDVLVPDHLGLSTLQ